MGADMSIHIFKELTEDDLADFFDHTLGSKYFRGFHCKQDFNKWNKALDKIAKTPSIWIGGVSWLKASVFDDDETYVPDPVQKISELIGEDLPILDESLLNQIVDALQLENTTEYRINEPDKVKEFLNEHMGEKLFIVNW